MQVLAAFVLTVAVVSEAINPGLEIRLTEAGLSYAKSVGIELLNEKASTLTIPDQSGGGSWYSYDLSSIRITQFNAPDSGSSIQLGNELTWTSSGISVDLAANYKVTIGSGFFSVSHSGSVTVDGSAISFSITAALTDNQGHPAIDATSASVNIGTLNVHFDGNIIDEIADLFSSDIASYVQQELNSALQGILTQLINEYANQELNEIPISLQVYDGFSIDYSLIENPSMTANYVELDMRGVVFKDNDNPSIDAPTPGEPTDNSRMLYMIGTEFVMNTLGYATQESGVLQYLLTPEELDSLDPDASKYLATTCDGGDCIGSIIPQIGVTFPNATVEIQMTSTQAPTMQFSSDGIVGNFWGDADFKVRLQDNSVADAFSAAVSLNVIIVNLGVTNYVIGGQVHVTGATLSVTSSNVGVIDSDGLQQIWQLAMLGAIDGLLDTAIGQGFQIPTIPYVEFLNPVISLTDDTLIIATDVQYTGGL